MILLLPAKLSPAQESHTLSPSTGSGSLEPQSTPREQKAIGFGFKLQ
jgi:hypothetical protein